MKHMSNTVTHSVFVTLNEGRKEKMRSPVVEFLLLDSPQRPLKLPLTLNEKHSFRRYNTSNSIAQLNWIFDPGNVSMRLNGTMVRQNRKG